MPQKGKATEESSHRLEVKALSTVC